MSRRGDSKRSMRERVTIDDATAEAVLSGRPVVRNELADDLAGVVGVMAEIRALGDRAAPVPTPSAALARLFADGDSSLVQSGARAEHPAMGGARLRRLSVRTRSVGASLASLGVIGVIGVAGAAGALPAPAQHALARAVRTFTPFTIPDPVAAANDGTPVSPSSAGIRSDGSGSTLPIVSTNTRVGRDMTTAPTSLAVVPEGSAGGGQHAGTHGHDDRLDEPTGGRSDHGESDSRPHRPRRSNHAATSGRHAPGGHRNAAGGRADHSPDDSRPDGVRTSAGPGGDFNCNYETGRWSGNDAIDVRPCADVTTLRADDAGDVREGQSKRHGAGTGQSERNCPRPDKGDDGKSERHRAGPRQVAERPSVVRSLRRPLIALHSVGVPIF